MDGLSLGHANRHIHIAEKHGAVSYPEPKKLAKFHDDMKTAVDVGFLPNGNYFIVCDKKKGQLRVHDINGTAVKKYSHDICPVGLAISPKGMIAVVDRIKDKKKGLYNGRILVFNSDKWDLHSSWGDDYKWTPRGIAFDNKGWLVITDVLSHMIGVYSQDGKELNKFGDKLPAGEKLKYPCGVAVDRFDRILVADRDNHVVRIFDENGKQYLGRIGRGDMKAGSGAGHLCSPGGVCTDNRSNILVSDTGNKRISVFSVQGQYIQDLLTAKQGLAYPFGVAINNTGNHLVVTQHDSNKEDGKLKKVRVYELKVLPPLKLQKGETSKKGSSKK